MSGHVAELLSPYKGLAVFEDSSDDASLFFGRERESEIVTANLLAYRVTVLYGESGVGKSSLLRAGVAHRLRAQGESVVVFDAWSGQPLEDLLEQARQTLRPAMPEQLLDTPVRELADAIEVWTAALGRRLYIILDQLEELFLYHPGDEGFASALAALATRSELPVNLLLSVRADMLAHLDRFKDRIPSLLSNYLRLDHLDRHAAREAIVRPVERYNALRTSSQPVALEPKLVEAVLDQTASRRFTPGRRQSVSGEGGRVEAPFLQLVMQRLWQEELAMGSTTLRLETLARLGGAEEIVRGHLVEAVESLPPGERDLAASLFHQLVTPSGTKVAHSLGDLADYAAASEAEIVPVLAALVDDRIVRPVKAAGKPHGERYEIFHDVLAQPVSAWRVRHEAERALERTQEQARRRHRRLLVVAVAAVLTAVAMIGLTIFAFSQRSEAQAGARRAHARELDARALARLRSAPQRSLRLALDAARLTPNAAAEDALRRVLVQSYERAVLPQGSPVTTVAFSPRGNRVAAGSAGGDVHLYTPSGRLVGAHAIGGRVTGVAFNADGSLLAASATGGALLLDPRTGRVVHTLARAGGVTSLAFGGGVLATAGGDGTVRVWSSEGRLRRTLRSPGPVTAIDVSRGGAFAVGVARDRDGRSRARIFDLRHRRRVRVLDEPGVITAAFSPNGRLIATGSADTTAQLWNARTGRRLHTLEHHGHVTALAFSRNGRSLATASSDGLGRVWDVATGELRLVLPGSTQPLDSVAISDDGRFVVVSGGDDHAYVYDAGNSWLRAALIGHSGPVGRAVFSPRAQLVATASDDGTLRLWDPDVADRLRLFRRVERPVTAAFTPRGDVVIRPLRPRSSVSAVSPDGHLIAKADGNVVVVSERASGRVVRTLRGQFGTVEALSFSPDGNWLVTAGPTAAILWWLRTGELLYYLWGHAAEFGGRAAHLTSAEFSPDGKRIVTASLDRTVRVFECRVCGGLRTLVPLAERRLARISARS